jgi:uncharacterized protein (TIGR03000 family)
MSKHFLTTVALCAAILLIGADANLFGGGGHGGGGHGGGYGRGGYGYGGFYGGGFYGYGYGGFYGGGLFYGDYYGGGYPGYYAPYGYPYLAPSYSYTNPIVPNSAPRIASNPSSVPANPYYYPPLTAAYKWDKVPAPVVASQATIRVVLPDPQATVLFEGRTTTSTGSERLYHSPDLTSGRSYNYKLRVSWMQDGQQVTQERTIAVTPGQTTDVVFTRTLSEAGPAVSVAK